MIDFHNIDSVVRHGYRTASIVDRFLTIDYTNENSTQEYQSLEDYLCDLAGFKGDDRNHSCFIVKQKKTGGCIYIEFSDFVIYFGEGISLWRP